MIHQTEEIKYADQNQRTFISIICLLTFIDFQNRPSSNYTDINQILDQILNITDQSLDEAQVKDSCNCKLYSHF